MRNAEGIAHDLREFFDMSDQIVVFGDGDRDAVGVDFWKASVPIIEAGT